MFATKKELLNPKWDWHVFAKQVQSTEFSKLISAMAAYDGTLGLSIPNVNPSHHTNHLSFSLNPFRLQTELEAKNKLAHLQNVQSGGDLI